MTCEPVRHKERGMASLSVSFRKGGVAYKASNSMERGIVSASVRLMKRGVACKFVEQTNKKGVQTFALNDLVI